ncbi:hypothetical protein RUM44_007897 [Polyplax serrata]|uniref:Cyclic nucleotide-binding domain-containing protein n=1 Tax=Polyplax serrata TaxID=468196 RepID=A0ABR1BB85_POLSC
MSFKSLVSAVSEQRQEIKQSLTLFPYFDTWDSKVIAECCQLSKIIEFPPDEIILGSGTTNSHMTFFILEGVCKIIHHLHVRVKVDSYGRATYKLYNSEQSGTLNSQSGATGFASLLFNQKHDFQREEQLIGMEITGKAITRRESLLPPEKLNNPPTQLSNISEEEYNEEERLKYERSKEGIKEFPSETAEKVQDDEDDDDNNKDHRTDEINEGENEARKKDESNVTENNFETESSQKEITAIEQEEIQMTALSQENNALEEVNHGKETENSNSQGQADHEVKDDETYHLNQHLKVLEKCRAKSKQLVRLADEKPLPELPKDVKSFFVQVALFYKGACFGLEENMKDTFIMSATKVKCLRIPRRFLLQHNPCNIWNRIRLFFSLYLPPEKQILDYLTSHRKWNNMKRKKSEEIVSLKRIPNYILCSEVPFSIRLNEMPRCKHNTC